MNRDYSEGNLVLKWTRGLFAAIWVTNADWSWTDHHENAAHTRWRDSGLGQATGDVCVSGGNVGIWAMKDA